MFNKNQAKYFISVIIFLIILLIYKSWFFLNPLSSGDWSFNFKESIKTFNFFPYSWNFNLNAGLGGTNSFILSLSSYFFFTTSFLFNILKIPWVLIERLVWFWSFLIISVFSSYFLFKKLFLKKFAILSAFIFLLNTYILMVVGGGQMGIAISYSIVPLVLYSFIKLNQNIKLKYSVLFGVLFGILVMFDLRIAYITLSALGIYFLFNIKQLIIDKDLNEIVVNISYIFIIPFAVSGLLHAFWILPLLVFHQNPAQQLGGAYNSTEAVKFFSFAKFEDSISLLHPNWPENIFGKVGFMKPEFLMLPILAYSSLLFVNIKHKTESRRKRTYILYFALLGLIGAFLAKGANDPFGGIYLWMFIHIPGFIMFRDPTKWYTLVAISYSILIPFSIWKIYEWLKIRGKFSIFNFQFSIKFKFLNLSNLFLILTTLYLLFLIRPALFGQLTGTFKSRTIPNDYIKLEQFLSSQNNFSRTFWVPTQQRFEYYTNNHPAVSGQNFFQVASISSVISKLNNKDIKKILSESSVRYVIVPYDSEGEIFLKDRKYDKKQYEQAVKEIQNISWLKRIDGFGKIALFQVPNPKDHFWSPSTSLRINYKFINPTKYEVNIKNAKKGDLLVFSEGFDKYWMLKSQISQASPSEAGRANLKSQKYHELFNSFVLDENGNYSAEIYYEPQGWVNLGIVISTASLIIVLAFLGFSFKKW